MQCSWGKVSRKLILLKLRGRSETARQRRDTSDLVLEKRNWSPVRCSAYIRAFYELFFTRPADVHDTFAEICHFFISHNSRTYELTIFLRMTDTHIKMNYAFPITSNGHKKKLKLPEVAFNFYSTIKLEDVHLILDVFTASHDAIHYNKRSVCALSRSSKW
jgi:hypothetical protein